MSQFNRITTRCLPRAGGAAQWIRRLQAHRLCRRSSKGAGTQWLVEARDKSAVLS